jgi:hypothetical protein
MPGLCRGKGRIREGLLCTVDGSRSMPHDYMLQLVASACMSLTSQGGDLGDLLLNCGFLSQIGHFHIILQGETLLVSILNLQSLSSTILSF